MTWQRGRTIRTRTAVAFAGATTALTTAVIVFVALASQAALTRAVEQGAVDAPSPLPGGGALTPDPDGGAAGGSVATLTQASALQWQWSVVGIVGAGLLAGLVGWLLSRRVLAPIDRITATANRISAENLHQRIALDGPDDELRRLARTIDALLDRLDGAFERQRTFVAQASHELRTPLAVQRAALQIGLGDGASPDEVAEVREQLLAENRRSEHLVESLLVLAQADRGLDARRGTIDLGALASDVLAAARDTAAAAGVTVTCDVTGTGPWLVDGEPVLVRQVLANLVDNAVEYNLPGGGGVVHVLVDEQGVTVENTGHLVRPEVAATLVEPFRRDGDRGGSHPHSGLGLSIVAAVVAAHGWYLSLSPRDGGGLVVRVGVSPVQRDGAVC